MTTHSSSYKKTASFTQIGSNSILTYKGKAASPLKLSARRIALLLAGVSSFSIISAPAHSEDTSQSQQGSSVRTFSPAVNTENTIAAPITDSGENTPLSVEQAGAGTTILSAINTYTGTTHIKDGTLALSGIGNIASSSGISIEQNANFDISKASANATVQDISGAGSITLGNNNLILSSAKPNTTYDGIISGVGGLNITGGAKTLTAAQTYTGTTTVDQNTSLTLSGSIAGSLDNSGTSTLQKGSSVAGDVTNSGALNATNATLSKALNNSDTATLTNGSQASVSNSGTATLAGGNNTTGDVSNKSGGTLTLDNSSIAGALNNDGQSTLQNGASVIGTVTNSSTGTLNATNAALNALNNAGTATLTGGSQASLSNNGTVTLAGGNNTTGDVSNKSNRTLTLDNSAIAGALNNDGQSTLQNGASVIGTVTNSSTGTLNATNATLNALNNTGTATLTGGSQASATNSGDLTLAGSDKASGNKTDGDVSNTGNGTLKLDNNTISGTLTHNGKDLTVTNNGATAGSLAGSSDGTLNGSLTLSNAKDTYNGTLSGGGGLIVNGGTETLTKAQNYSGDTEINNGATLALTGNGNLEKSTIQLNAGNVTGKSTLDISKADRPVSIASIGWGNNGATVNLGGNTLNIVSAIGSNGATFQGDGGTIVVSGASQAFNGTIQQTPVDDGTTSDGTTSSGTPTNKDTTKGVNLVANAANVTLNAGRTFSYTGTTTVNSGSTLHVNGNSYGTTSIVVNDGGKLDGTGNIGGVSSTTTIAKNATIAPGTSDLLRGTLGIGGGLTVNGTSDFSGVQSNSSGKLSNGTIFVGGDRSGDLTLGGTVKAVDLSFQQGSGIQTLYRYTQNLNWDNPTLKVYQTSGAEDPNNKSVLQGGNHQVNLVTANTGDNLTFWNGNTTSTSTTTDHHIDAGDGTWTQGKTNWTTANGDQSSAWQEKGYAIFGQVSDNAAQQNTKHAYNVTVDGNVDVAGMQFSQTTRPSSYSIIPQDNNSSITLYGNRYTDHDNSNQLNHYFSVTDNIGQSGTPSDADIKQYEQNNGILVNKSGLVSVIRVGDGTGYGDTNLAVIKTSIKDDPANATTLVKTDTGTLVLSGTNSYTGGTVITNGTLGITSDASLGNQNGALNINGGTLRIEQDQVSTNENRNTVLGFNGATINLNGYEYSNNGSIIGPRGANLKIVSPITDRSTYDQDSKTPANPTIEQVFNTSQQNAGISLGGNKPVLNLNGENTYLGNTDIEGNNSTGDTNVVVNANSKTPFGYSDSTTKGGDLNITGGATVNMNGGQNQSASMGNRNVTLQDSSVLNFNNHSVADTANITNGSNASVSFNDSSSASQSIIQNAGTVSFTGNATADGATIQNNNDGAKVDISKTSNGVSIGSLSGNGTVSLGNQTLTIGALGKDDTLSATINGANGSLVKTGNGTQTLTGNNSYTGSTTVDNGTLALAGNGAIAQSSFVNINKGTNLDISQSSNNQNLTDIRGGGNIALGSHSLSLTQADSNHNYDGVISGDGGLTIQSGTKTLTNHQAYTGDTTIAQNAGLNLTGSLDGTLTNHGNSILQNDSVVKKLVTNTGKLDAHNAQLLSDVTTSGTLLLDKGTTVSGKLTAEGGKFTIGDGGASVGSLSGTNNNTGILNGTLTLTNAKDGYDGTLTGKGGLTILGGGQNDIQSTGEYLNGHNTYEGETHVGPNGSFTLKGSITGALNNEGSTYVNPNAATAGQSSIGGTTTNTNLFTSQNAILNNLINNAGTSTLNESQVKAIENNAGQTTLTGTQAGAVTNAAGATFKTQQSQHADGTTINNSLASADNKGTMTLDHTTVNGQTTNSKDLNVTNSALRDISNNAGTTTLDSSSTADHVTNAKEASFHLQNSGTISSADNKGTMTLASFGKVSGDVSNTDNGSLTLDNGTINGTLTHNGADLTVTKNNATIGSLTGNGGGTLDGALHISNDKDTYNDKNTYSGVLSGAGGIAIDKGTEALTGKQKYTGDTTVAQNAGLNLSGALTGAFINSGTSTLQNGSSVNGLVTNTEQGSLNAHGAQLEAVTTNGNLLLDQGTAIAHTLAADGGNITIGKDGASAESLAGKNSSTQITLNDTLTLTGGHDGYDGTLTGKGGLTILGGGQNDIQSTGEYLNGHNTYEGETHVGPNGSFTLKGSITGALNNEGSTYVNPNAATAGQSSIGGTTTNTNLFTSQNAILNNLINNAGTSTLNESQVKAIENNAGQTTLTGTQAGAVTNAAGATFKTQQSQHADGTTINNSLASADNKGTMTLDHTTVNGQTTNSKDLNVTNSALRDISNNAGTTTLDSSSTADHVTNAKEASFHLQNSGTISSADNKGTMTLASFGKVSGDVSNTDNGSLTLDNGTINGTLTHNGADLTVTKNNATIGSLTGNGGGTLDGALHISNDKDTYNDKNTYSGVLSGAGGIAIDKGTEALTGKQKYTGDTTVAQNAGLNLSGALTGAFINSGTSTLQNGSSVNGLVTNTEQGSLNAHGAQLEAVTTNGNLLLDQGTAVTGKLAADGGKFTIGDGGASVGTLSGTSNNTGILNSTLTLTKAKDGYDGTLNGKGGLTIAGGVETLNGQNKYTGDTHITNAEGAGLDLTGSIAGKLINDQYTQVEGPNAQVNGTTTNNKTLVVSNGATLANLSNNGTATFTNSRAGDVTNTKEATFKATGGSQASATNNSGDLTLAGGNKTDGDVTNKDNGTLKLDGNTIGGTLTQNGKDMTVTNNGAKAASLAGNGNGTLEGTLRLSNDSQTVTDKNTYNGVLKGTGGLAIDKGTEALTNHQAYTGDTTVAQNAGLNLTGSLAGALNNSGTSTLQDGSSVAGEVTNSGKLNATNATLSKALNNSGTTTLQDGSSVAGEVTNSGTLNATNATLSKALNNTGTATLTGGSQASATNSGDLTLAGGNKTDGDVTNKDNGTLKLDGNTIGGTLTQNGKDLTVTNNGANAASLAGNGNGTLDGTLTLNNAKDTYNGALSGNGGLTINGGTEVLTGNSTYAGPTTIQNQATLEVDGNNGLANGLVTVGNGATLRGTGTVGSTQVASEGVIAPGAIGSDTPSTLHINGNLTMAQGSILRIRGTSDTTSQTIDTAKGTGYEEVTSDRLAVTGKANLQGGTLDLQLKNAGLGLTYNQAYRVLTATDGISGQFDAKLSSNLAPQYAYLDPTFAYSADAVDIVMRRKPVSFSVVGETRNQITTGHGLDRLDQTSTLSKTMTGLTRDQARQALDNLSGELHASIRTALIQDSFYIRNAVMNRLANSDCDYGRNGQSLYDLKTHEKNGTCYSDHAVLWGQAYGGLGHNGGDGNAALMNHNTAGFIMGADAPINGSNWRVGGLLSYGHSQFNIQRGRSSSGNSNNITVGSYAGTHWGRLNLRLGAAYSWNVINTQRHIAVGNYGGRVSSGYLGGTAQTFAELGYKMRTGRGVFEPFMNVSYVNMQTNSYREHGNEAALRSRGTDSGVTFSTFGFRAATQLNIGRTLFTPHLTAAYRRGFGRLGSRQHESFATTGGSSSMDVAGVLLSDNAAIIDTGVTARLNDRVDLDLSYIGQYGNQSTESGATGSFKMKF